jgi:rhomboid protease GluP
VQSHMKPVHPERETSGASLSLEPLQGRGAWMSVTSALIVSNVLVAGAMLVLGAGLGHTSSTIQMEWGANFGPATKDGEWWRLGTAMFLHFGALHLGMNMFALWDSGRLVERVFGPGRFAAIYIASGLSGNLLSLIAQGDRAVSGGASGAVFGVYGAFLAFLLIERRRLHPSDFKLMFWGAAIFSAVTLALGQLIPGIDNAAHLGGLIAGAMTGFIAVPRVAVAGPLGRPAQIMAACVYVSMLASLIMNIPDPRYRWSEEQLARGEIREFLGEDARINARLRAILAEQPVSGASFEQLAGQIETEVVESYEQSFDQLSSLHISPQAPSAEALARLRDYAEARRDASQALAEGIREKDTKRIREALDSARQASQGVKKEVPPMGGTANR